MPTTPTAPTKLPRAVVFDWDNTLVDTWPIIHDALNHTFRAFNKPEWSLAETHKRVRQSLRDSFPGLFGDEWERAGEVFYQRYEEIHATNLVVATGAAGLLDELSTRGVYLCVVSNKKGHYLRKEALFLGWDQYFGAIVGAMDAPRDKPAPDPVHMALEPGDIVPSSDVWFVGDADIDMMCAHSAGCYPVLVRASPPIEIEFDAHPPGLHVTDCDTLCKLCKTL